MALSATIHRFEIDLSDVDRGLYTALDVRVARHPSESLRYLLTRTLAYALSYEDGLAFSKGLSTAEPAVWRKDPGGKILLWIDVGTPSAERLHKASKASERVAVYTHDTRHLAREAKTRAIHAAERIEVSILTTEFLDGLEPLVERHTKMQLLFTGGTLYATASGRTVEGPVTRHSLAEV